MPVNEHYGTTIAARRHRTGAALLSRCFLALFLALPVALLTGCPQATTSTPVPPKQSLDLQFARALVDAQAAIDQAKPLVATNPALRDPLNRIIAVYNAAVDAQAVYHAAVIAGSNPDATALQAQIAQLAAGVAQLRGMFR